jgi:hypothetical protein
MLKLRRLTLKIACARLLLASFCVFQILFSIIPVAQVQAASAPNIVNYQGRVLNANGIPVTDTSISMIFELYTAVSGGSCVWSNSSATCASATSRSVTLTDGLFSEALGDTASSYAAIGDSIFGDNAALFLQVTIGGEVLSPRKQLVAAPYALNSDTVDGLDADNDGSTTAAIVALNSSGNAVFTGDPTGATVSTGVMYLNPAAAGANETIFGIGDNGTDRFRVDKEGDVFIKTIELDGAGSDNVTSGASLIGVFDELGLSSATTVQDVLDDLDQAIDDIVTGGAVSKWTDGGTFTYLTATADDFVLGAATVGAASLFFDESAGQLDLGTEDALGGILKLYSSGVGIADVTLASDATGNLDLTAIELTLTGDLAVAGGDLTSTSGTFNFLDAASNSTTLDIGGVTTDLGNTINVATNSTTADALTIGNANAATTIALTGGDDWSITGAGVLTLSASASATTAIVATDTDYTNALSVGDNNIIGTTAAIDFTNFDVATTGAITVAAGVGLDTNGAGALTLGNTNATSVSLCNSAACDTLTLGTNTDADTITIGEANDDVSIVDAQWSITAAGGASFTTLSSTGITTIGNNSATVAIDSSDWDISTTGAITGASFDANGTGNSISNLENADLANDTIDFDKIIDSATLDAAFSVTAAAGRTFTFARTLTDATTENGLVVNVTAADTTSGTSSQFGLYLDNLASTEGLDASLVIDNSDADDAVGAAIKVVNAGGGFTNILDNAGTLISSSEINLLDGGIALSELTDSGTLTATTVDINGGAIDGTAIGASSPSTGDFTTLSSTGVTVLGNNSATVAINSSDWDIDATGAITGVAFDANGSGNSITNIDNADLTNDTIDFDKIVDAATLDAATSVTGAAGRTFTFARTLTDATTENGVVINTTAADTSSGTTSQFGLYLDNLASTEGLDASLVIDNSDADDAVGAAIKIVNAGGGFTNIIDNAGTLLSGSEINLLDSGIALSELTDSGTLTATTVDINGGAIDGTAIGASSPSSGAFTTLSSTGVTTLGNNSATVAIDSTTWDISTAGVATFAATSGQTTAIDITDTDYTNALSVADNNIIGTTAAIDFTNFDVATTGAITVAAGVGLDTNGAGALALGNTNATSVSLCNSAACDTLSLGTNTDADTITIGESNDDVSITDAQWSITAAGAASFTSIALNDDVDFTFATDGASSENFTIVSTHATDASLNVVGIQFTDSAAADTGTNYLLDINNADDGGSTGTPDGLFRIRQSDTDEAVAAGITFDVAAGALTTAIDASDAQIGTALSVGANDIVGTTGAIDFTTFDVTSNGALIQTLASPSTGAFRAHVITNGSPTNQTLNTEISNIISTAYTRTWANGAITNQREVYFGQPTYAFASLPSTITNAANIYIEGAPAAGANASITNSYALWTDAGNARFDGSVMIGATSASSVLHADSNAVNTTAILTLENTNGDFQVFRTDVTPESSVTGSIGDIAVDSTNGVFYGKITGNATSTGWLSFANNGAAASFTTLGASDDVDFTFVTDGAGSENFTIASTHATDVNLSPLQVSITNTAAANTGTNYVADFSNADEAGATGTPDGLLRLRHLDTDEAISTGLTFDVAAGTMATAIDASDAQITTAISVGANDIVGTTGLIDFTNFDVVADGSITIASGSTIGSTGSMGVGDGSTTSLSLCSTPSCVTLSLSPGGGGSAGFVGIGGTGDTVSIDTTTWDIDTAGVFTTSGNIAMTRSGATTVDLLNLTETSAALTSADLIGIDHTSIYTSAATLSGQGFDLNRSVVNNSGGLLTVSGDLAVISSSVTNSSGTLVDSARLLFLDQNASGATGNILAIDNAGSGSSIFVNPGLATGSTVSETLGGAVHIDNTGNANYGLSVYSNIGTGSSSPIAYVFSDNSGYDVNVMEVRNDTNSNTSSALVITQDIVSNATSAATSQALVINVNEDDAGNSDEVILVLSDADGTPDAEFRLELDGDLFADGAAYNAGADYAEFFYTLDASLGDHHVVCQDLNNDLAVKKCDLGDPTVIGVVSTSPGFVGNNIPGADGSLEDHPNYRIVGLEGQVETYVTAADGSVAVGDALTASSLTAGYAGKASAAGRIIGFALEPLASGSGLIKVRVSPGWHAGDILNSEGEVTSITNTLALESLSTATAAAPASDSNMLSFRGSAWNGSSAQTIAMSLSNKVTSASSYRLSVANDGGTEVAYINNLGDLVLSGKLYPSNQGTAQTSAYIYYDSTGVGYMRTNAAGWSTGSYDFAEMFPSPELLTPGDVVVFGDGVEQVKRSTGETYDDRIAGVVSTRPGFLAGTYKVGDHPIALTGRVPTRVSTENGAIAIGDPLTTSSTPGVAMKATEPGPIVGYAMEPFTLASGTISVFIRASYYDGNSTPSLVNAPITNTNGNFTNLNLNAGQITSVASISGIGDTWKLNEHGDLVTRGRLVQVIKSHQGEDVETYAAASTEMTVQLSGTSTFSGDAAVVAFEDIDPQFNDVIAAGVPYRVFATPSGATGQVYVINRSQSGFTIKAEHPAEGILVDWLVIAYHKDYEPETEVAEVSEVPADNIAGSEPVLEPAPEPEPEPAVAGESTEEPVDEPTPEEESVPTAPSDDIVVAETQPEPEAAPHEVVDEPADEPEPVVLE